MAVAIISIAQQARPKATGQREERRAQLTTPSTEPRRMFCLSDSSMESAVVSVTLMRLSVIEGDLRLGIVSQTGAGRWKMGEERQTESSASSRASRRLGATVW